MMNIQQRYERILQGFNRIDSLLGAIGHFQAMTRRVYPNAVLLTTTADNGVLTHIGVYDVALQLQPKGYFKPLEQPCPQLLGERISLGTSIGSVNDKLVRLVQELSCWITAFDHAIRLNDGLSITGNDYVTTFDPKNKMVVTNLLN